MSEIYLDTSEWKKVDNPYVCPYCGSEEVEETVNMSGDTVECNNCGRQWEVF